MPISFLNPLLLWGAVAAVIPLALHFWRRRLARDVRFSDLRFLREVQAQQARTVGVKRYLLLLLRMLIIILLAALLAGPRLSGLSAGGGRESVLMLIDGGASMQTRDGEAIRFETALAEAVAMGGSMGRQGEVQMLQVGALARPLFADWVPSQMLSGASLDAVQADDTAFDPIVALTAAADWAIRARYREKDLLLIGDFQPVQPDTAALRTAVDALKAAGVRRIMLRRVGGPVINGGILDVSLPLRVLVPGEMAVISAVVQPGHSAQDFEVELDGRRIAQAVASVGAGAVQTLDFPLVAPRPGLHSGRVLTTADRLAVDDSYAFTLEIPERIHVLIVHGEDQDRAGRGSWRYLAGALSPEGSGLFDVHDLAADDLHDSELYRSDLVIFVDPGRLGSKRLEAVIAWLRQGGRGIFLIGDPRMTDYLAETLLPAIGGGGVAFRSESEAGAQGLRLLPGGQALLEGFPDPSLETLIESRWRRYHALDPGRLSVLIEFDGGDPALLESDLGEGRILLLPFNLATDASDFAGNPMSVPFWRRLSVHLLGDSRRSAPALRAGDSLRLRLGSAQVTDRLGGSYALQYRSAIAGSPATVESRPLQLDWQGMVPVLDGGIATRSGVYAYLSDGDTLGLQAVAVPAAESQSAAGSITPFRDLLEAAGWPRTTDLSAAEPTGFGSLLAGRDLRILMAALIAALLLVETWISRKA